MDRAGHPDRIAALAAVLALGCATAQPSPGHPAVAPPPPPAPAEPARRAQPEPDDWRQLIQPDALVFVWGSAAAAAGAVLFFEPPVTPRGFDPGEGGVPANGETIPNWQVGAGVALVPLAIGLGGDDSRWYHTKGVLQALFTTAAFTELAKNSFGRHRPSYHPDTSVEDDRKSFFSGHSSLTLASTTYTGLWLHDHVFAHWRGDAAFAWWEVPPYLALGALSVWVPYTRIADAKHHRSDVLTGAAVGTLMGVGFYAWQDSRYWRNRNLTDRLVLLPMLETPGAIVMGRF